MAFEVFVRSELVDVTHLAAAELGEDFVPDPDPILGEVFYAVVASPKGRVWVHRHGFFGEGAEASAEALVARVAAALEAGRRLDQDHWTEDRPIYGSEAYLDQGY
jgi:hypothetical protein